MTYLPEERVIFLKIPLYGSESILKQNQVVHGLSKFYLIIIKINK